MIKRSNGYEKGQRQTRGSLLTGVTDGFAISSVEESFAGAGELVTVSIGDGSALVRGTGVPDLSPACISHQQEDLSCN